MSFPVKRSDMLMDVDTVAYVLGDRGFLRNAVFGARVIAVAEEMNAATGAGLGIPDHYKTDDPYEFVLDRGCLDEYNAKREVERFKEWLEDVRRKANINLDGLDVTEE